MIFVAVGANLPSSFGSPRETCERAVAVVAAAGSMVAEAVIWDLTAGLAARDPELALDALHRLQDSGDDARKLLGMIAWQMREILRVAELAASYGSAFRLSFLSPGDALAVVLFSAGLGWFGAYLSVSRYLLEIEPK